jgi:2-oxoglutarate ferredoxin oxidoreductase subunit alpha
MHLFADDLSIVFGGAAGQGVQTITSALIPVMKKEGYHLFSCTEYMSRIRGGSNSTQIRITGRKRQAYVSRIDFLFALNAQALEHLQERVSPSTLVFAEKALLPEACSGQCIDTPLQAFASQAGNPVFSNTAAVGIVLGIMNIPLDTLTDYLRRQFAQKGETVVSQNITAASLGYAFGRQTAETRDIRVEIPRHESQSGTLLMDGTAAAGIGAVAGGINFISSYPMSPGTGVLTFLAWQSQRFGIVTDQAEDEIAAINAGIGASYAGARALVTTSGGGFALMEEGLSLSGMTETPIVIHIGQRPGPATGMPTRTEQADLNLVLFAGHGEFARAVFAPGSLEEIIETMQKACDLSQLFQIPVFVLTDQYLLDAVSTIEATDIRLHPIASHIVMTSAGYEQYSLSEDGLSPRGVPGYGEGLVRADSHEHDENSRSTERFDVRKTMVDKRLRRLKTLRESALMPTLIGRADAAETLIISWGSTRGVLEEALDRLGNPGIAGMHFSQVFPINPALRHLLEGKRLAVLENNATGQFADLLGLETGRKIQHRILKATGQPFSVEELVESIRETDHA